MTQKETITKDKFSPASAYQHEDTALKTAAQFFAEELLPYLGIEGKVVSSAPTESIVLNLQKFYEDINLLMEDGSLKHFEFQSKNEGIPGLKRFRSYESVTSYQYDVSVTTYVLYSGNIKNPVTEFTEGINTYRVIPIIMRDHDADKLIQTLKDKIANRQKITKEDLVPLTLISLMNGQSSQKERIMEAFSITEQTGDIPQKDLRKIEAVIYTMADKFLEETDFKQVKEWIGMTRLGQMIFDDGFKDGAEKKQRQIARNLIGILSDEMIAEKTELPLETVLQLKKESLQKA